MGLPPPDENIPCILLGTARAKGACNEKAAVEVSSIFYF